MMIKWKKMKQSSFNNSNKKRERKKNICSFWIKREFCFSKIVKQTNKWKSFTKNEIQSIILNLCAATNQTWQFFYWFKITSERKICKKFASKRTNKQNKNMNNTEKLAIKKSKNLNDIRSEKKKTHEIY